jgi:hypothetical protein
MVLCKRLWKFDILVSAEAAEDHVNDVNIAKDDSESEIATYCAGCFVRI